MLTNSNSSITTIRYYFSFVIVALYFAIGCMFLFTDAAIEVFPVYRTPVGVLLIVYAGYRAFVVVRKEKARKAENK
jgi:uncharacterized membrane protein